ncbi:MAG: hypothetical protein IT374_07140 [Polyangiaceae bacterium]|nr:hypothetical protein [Polyangiaceae bacterium]
MSDAPPASPPRFVARWDLDKTYLRTEFDTFRDLLRTALEKPEQKRTVPGAATLLRELGDAGGEIHILSGSPRQMRGRIERKLSLDGARFHSLTLKPNLSNLLRLRLRAVRDQLGYKLPALLASRASMGARSAESGAALPEVLLGDDAEADALVYSLYADASAGLVSEAQLGRLMRLAGSYDDHVERALQATRAIDRRPAVRHIFIHLDRQTPPSRFRKYGARLVPFFNYLQPALVIADDGLLSPAAVGRVASELVVAHRFDGDALARSYLDLRQRGHLRGALDARVPELLDGALPEARSAVEEMSRALPRLLARLAPVAPPGEPELDYEALVASSHERRASARPR